MPILFIGIPGGNGRCSRCAARRSAGDSNATTGAPKERPMREDSAPPSYSKINVRNHKQYDRSKRKSAYGMTRQPDTGIWVHEGNIVIKILFRRGVKVTRANQNDRQTSRFRQQGLTVPTAVYTLSPINAFSKQVCSHLYPPA